MDNLTHTLIGVGLARAGLAQRVGRGTTVVLAVASNLPDVDVAFLAGGPLAFLWRRTLTHSVLGSLALVLVAAAVFRRLYPNLPWRAAIGVTALGVAGHVFADLWNAYGVVVFWPFSWRRVDWDWVFIIDLSVWGILVAALTAGWMNRRLETRVWRLGLAGLAGYLGLCASGRYLSADLLRQETQAAQTAHIHIYPEPLGPHRFRGVVQGASRYDVYLIRPFQKTVELLEQVDIQDSAAVVESARRTQAGQRLDWFFSTPVWRAVPDGQAARVHGLGFRPKTFDLPAPFVFRVTPDGRVARDAL
jgi:inner membrane protein